MYCTLHSLLPQERAPSTVQCTYYYPRGTHHVLCNVLIDEQGVYSMYSLITSESVLHAVQCTQCCSRRVAHVL